MQVYRAVALTTLLIGSGTRVTYSNHTSTFPIVSISVVFAPSSTFTGKTLLQMCKSWTGLWSQHRCLVAKKPAYMGKARLPNGSPQTTKNALQGELTTGYRKKGARMNRYKDCLRKPLKTLRIDDQTWSDLATDHSAWHSTISEAMTNFVEDRRASLKEKSFKRKAPDVACICGRRWMAYHFHTDLFSHERSCTRRWHILLTFLYEAKPRLSTHFINDLLPCVSSIIHSFADDAYLRSSFHLTYMTNPAVIPYSNETYPPSLLITWQLKRSGVMTTNAVISHEHYPYYPPVFMNANKQDTSTSFHTN